MAKIGLVLEGGGMKCAYGAAILDRFLDDDITFPYVIGVSAGAANAVSYLAGQRGRNKRFYTDHIHEKGYFGLGSFLKTGDLFGIDYIYSTLTNSTGADPLDWPALSKNPAHLEITSTNALTGAPMYFDAAWMRQDNYEILKSSCSIPAACHPRMIEGTPYVDGGVSDSIPCDRALSQGCEKLVVILSKPRGYVKKPEKYSAFYRLRCHKYPEIVKLLCERHILYQKSYDRAFLLEKEGTAFIFAANKALPASTYAMNESENQALYDLGLKEYEALRKSFFSFIDRS